MDDLDRLIAEAKKRAIEVWLDLVPNHTSDRHAWFDDRPEYYVWSKDIPNDWRSIFTKGSAWHWDARRRARRAAAMSGTTSAAMSSSPGSTARI